MSELKGKNRTKCSYLHGVVESVGKVELFVFKALDCTESG